jgi:hypothetical protein
MLIFEHGIKKRKMQVFHPKLINVGWISVYYSVNLFHWSFFLTDISVFYRVKRTFIKCPWMHANKNALVML